MPNSKLTAVTLVPLGVVCAIGASIVSYVRGADSANAGVVTEIAALKVKVESVERRVDETNARQDKSDVRWDRVVDDLSQIKSRLGIVEAKSPVTK